MFQSNVPIYLMNYSINDNELYIKREDLLPFSFGGNKVRIAEEYFKDMNMKKCNCIIAYGSSQSNLSRVIANMSITKQLPCYVISAAGKSKDRFDTNNSQIINHLGVQIITCEKDEVAQTIKKVIESCKSKGLKPYYIYGDIYGNGNEKVAVKAYVDVYKEITKYENEKGIKFDYIFLASGTGTTQSGLISGKVLHDDKRKIVGISIARKEKQGRETISNNLQKYFEDSKKIWLDDDIIFEDEYVVGGYGKYNKQITETTKKVLSSDGVPLDYTYTGKAFWGMTEYLKKNSIGNLKILFIHTGGLPLFFDDIFMRRDYL